MQGNDRGPLEEAQMGHKICNKRVSTRKKHEMLEVPDPQSVNAPQCENNLEDKPHILHCLAPAVQQQWKQVLQELEEW